MTVELSDALGKTPKPARSWPVIISINLKVQYGGNVETVFTPPQLLAVAIHEHLQRGYYDPANIERSSGTSDIRG